MKIDRVFHLSFQRKREKKKSPFWFFPSHEKWKIGRCSLLPPSPPRIRPIAELRPHRYSSNEVLDPSRSNRPVLPALERGGRLRFSKTFSGQFKARPSLEQNPMFYARKSLRFALTSRIISALNPALTTMARFIASYRASIIPVIGGGGKGEGEK